MKSECVNVLLGAGFSRPVNLPLVAEINDKFCQGLLGKFLRFSDSQWRWFDTQNEVQQYNGRLNENVYVTEYVYEVLISRFSNEFGDFNYEKFYSFLVACNEGYLKEVYDEAFCNYQDRIRPERRASPSLVLEYFKQYNFIDLDDSMNFLLADLLAADFGGMDLVHLYGSFLQFLENYDKVNFFSLNHDLLLENILNQHHLSYSDGFSTNRSSIIGEDKRPLPNFQNSFPGTTKVYKLHGSINNRGFAVTEEEGHMHWKTGEIIYFRAEGPSDLHRAVRINPDNGQILQSFNSDIRPQFLTGTLKESLIASDYMYSVLYQDFEGSVSSGDDLLVVGYSFGDDHINSVLKNCKGSIINVNPLHKFPFGHALNIEKMDFLPF